VLTSLVAARRARIARPPSPTVADVADPSRGTRVALGLPTAALAFAALWLALEGWGTSIGAPALAGLLVTAALAERISVQIGPRSVYTPSVPPIALAALLGGPLAGLAAGAATQLGHSDAVWRRRGAWGGLAALQGGAAGLAGQALLTGRIGAPTAAALALLVITAVNTGGRLLIMLDRNARPVGPPLLNGVRVDLLETALVTPILAALVLSTGESEILAVGAMGAVVAGIAIAHRQGEEYRRRLADEEAIARRDPLTAAPNRRAFEEALVAEHARIVRGGQPAGLLLVDVDRFKAINDEYRHDAGDDVLKEIVGRLTHALRPSDVVARWGGDEITVLGPGIHGEKQLAIVCDRVRALVADEPIATASAQVAATVSVGATLLDGSVAPGEALARADKALYEAKISRNATALALPGVATKDAA
jgi:diguanylate cyclase (GGDEF)-like protein